MAASEALPIDEALPALREALSRGTAAVLVAPPGAGKTTRAPLALLDEPWILGRKLILLEPRRLAARAAAARMAATLGEQIGESVGLRVRLGSKTSPRNRVEVVTEGVFTRMILDDPELSGVAGVLFDEFHERSLDADFGLALALDAQAGLREDLRLLVMSATLDGARVRALLGPETPLIESAGRAFPVETRYHGRDPGKRIEHAVTEAVLAALRAETGSLLVFLPGQGEIRRVESRLAERLADAPIDIAPLYGALDQGAQDRALLPSAPGRRKVVLATSIAETSLTIAGVRVVIDSGLARVPRHEPDIGLTRLETRRVSRASADQRRGRAGRTQPGICIRLWEEAATGALEPFARPEILNADLSGLLLDCAAWGVSDPAALRFLDPPPRPALAEARALLSALGALDGEGRFTAQGRSIRDLPLPPRLARMVLAAKAQGDGPLAADIAAVLVERGLGGTDTSLPQRLEAFGRDRSARAQEMRRLARGWSGEGAPGDPREAGRVLALAYPDRIAKARGAPGAFLMANGRAAALEPHDSLAREAFLAIGEVAGGAAGARILLAAPLTPAAIEAQCADDIAEAQELHFDRGALALRARRLRRLGALVLAEQALPVPATPEAAALLAESLAREGIDRLPWTKAQQQLRRRVDFLRRSDEAWPDLGDGALSASARAWLAPFLIGTTSLAAIGPDDLDAALAALIPYDRSRRLEQDAPTHFEAPTGHRHPIDWEGEEPALAIRVQELFGLKQHPSVAGGRLPLVLHLLSPAHRPIQITRDLPGFWAGSWREVKAEMRGRYPKHVWPDDPAAATPTARAKPRGS